MACRQSAWEKKLDTYLFSEAIRKHFSHHHYNIDKVSVHLSISYLSTLSVTTQF